MFFTKIKYKLFLIYPNLYSYFIYLFNFFNRVNDQSKKKIEKIEDILDLEKNKIGLCLAHGPSLSPFLSDLSQISYKLRNKYCLLSVNKFEDQFNFEIDYRIVSNNFFSIALNYNFLKTDKTTLFYCDSVDLTNKFIVGKILNSPYLAYDQRHFKNKECEPRTDCCKNIINNRLTIQEELTKYTKSEIHYSSANTVAIHMLAFSILLGCKTIYLFGLDLNYKIGYVNKEMKNSDSFEPFILNILNDFKLINNMATNIGVKIYSTCKNSPINNIFEYVENPFINI
jgi:hypothetical protein